MLERVQHAHSANQNNLKTTLQQFCRQGDVEAIQSLLEHNQDLDVDISSTGKNTALHSALIHNQQGLVIDYLISRGANVNAFNSKGYNCVVFAITNCKGALALEKLVRAGAVWKDKFGRGKFSGMTVQELAIQHQNSDAVELLQRLQTEKGEKEPTGILGICSKTKNREMCPICNSFVKFPTKLTFVKYDQDLAEARELELESSESVQQIDNKDRYTSRKYLDQFLSHQSGEAYKKLCEIEYHGISNKNKLRKEISESYSILHAVHDCCTELGLLPKTNSSTLHLENTFLIDLCAGKSLTTALCGVLFPPKVCVQNNFLAVDKLPVHLVPHFLQDGNTSYLSRDIMGDQFFKEMEQEVDRQTDQKKTAVLVGMHLCGNLSERAIDLFERIPSIKALILCPCCLPKSRKKSNPSAFDSYLMNKGGDAYTAWASYLKDKIRDGDPDEILFDVRSYQDADMHSVRDFIITAIRK